MRWLVTGAAGMLGQDVVSAIARQGDTVVAADREDLDITDRAAVDRHVDGYDVVVNCAAWTDVDGAEAFVIARVHGTGIDVRRAARAGPPGPSG